VTTPPPGLHSRDDYARAAARREERLHRLSRLLTRLQRLRRLPTRSLTRRRVRLTLTLWRLGFWLLIKLPRLLRLRWRLR
jgi:hypothetical protein